MPEPMSDSAIRRHRHPVSRVGIVTTITDPQKKAELAIAYGGSRTLVAQSMTVGNGWGVAPMNWDHCYRIVVDGQATGDPIFSPEGYWAVMDALATDLGIRE